MPVWYIRAQYLLSIIVTTVMAKITLKGSSKNLSIEKISKALSEESYTLEAKNGAFFVHILDEQEEKAGKSLKKRANVKDIEELEERHNVKVTRKYTKREDRNYPELPHDHDANRSDSRFNARIDNETNQLATDYLKATKMTKKELTIKALRSYMEQNPPEL